MSFSVRRSIANSVLETQRIDTVKIHPDGRLWWIEDKETDEHTLPIQARLYTNLSSEEKTRLRAEAALLCPAIVKSVRSRNKYDDMVLFLLTYHGVICHQARDLFSAGSVKDPELLILDEPLHGLDNHNRRLVKVIIETFCLRPNKTLIMVTHYEEELPACITHHLNLARK